MTADIATLPPPEPLHPDIIANLVLAGDLSTMNQGQKVAYYLHRCRELNLDPAEQPFAIVSMKGGKLVLYALKACTDALCRIHKVTRTVISSEVISGLYVVRVRAEVGGRSDEDVGAVAIEGVKGDDLCNAMMKATTKAKRRVVLSLFGIGALDETELETVGEHSTETIEIEAPTTEMEELETEVRRLLADVKILRKEAGMKPVSWKKNLADILGKPWPVHPAQPTVDDYKIVIIGLERQVRELESPEPAPAEVEADEGSDPDGVFEVHGGEG